MKLDRNGRNNEPHIYIGMRTLYIIHQDIRLSGLRFKCLNSRPQLNIIHPMLVEDVNMAEWKKRWISSLPFSSFDRHFNYQNIVHTIYICLLTSRRVTELSTKRVSWSFHEEQTDIPTRSCQGGNILWQTAPPCGEKEPQHSSHFSSTVLQVQWTAR